jgi:hypothetical protein
VALDYAPTASTSRRTPRHGRLRELVAAGEEEYSASLRTIASYADELATIAPHASNAREPSWINGFLPGLDSAAIYAFLRARRPRTYLEVGSGNSTRFARRAISDGGLATRVVSIDPSPRAEVDAICDQAVRCAMEVADASLFSALGAGDVVFLDGSHRVFTRSDATVFFLDLLPAVAPGVLVGVHDVYLPDDYPDDISERHYSEQYLLGALLLGQPAWLRLVLAASYVSEYTPFGDVLRPLWSRPGLEEVETHGVAFWFETQELGGV